MIETPESLEAEVEQMEGGEESQLISYINAALKGAYRSHQPLKKHTYNRAMALTIPGSVSRAVMEKVLARYQENWNVTPKAGRVVMFQEKN